MLSTQDAHLKQGHAAEIIGKVQDDLTVKCYRAIDLGEKFGKGSIGGLKGLVYSQMPRLFSSSGRDRVHA